MTWRPRYSLRTLALFLLLVTSGMGLWWHWEPWYCEVVPCTGEHPDGLLSDAHVVDSVIPAGRSWASPDGSMEIHVTKELIRVQDPRTGKPISSFSYPGDPFFYAHIAAEGRRVGTQGEDLASMWDTATGRKLFGAYGKLWVVSCDGNEMAVLGFGADTDRVAIYRRRRPEWWWGVFCLWEFWLTVAFAGVFVWSVVRDRRALKARASE